MDRHREALNQDSRRSALDFGALPRCRKMTQFQVFDVFWCQNFHFYWQNCFGSLQHGWGLRTALWRGVLVDQMRVNGPCGWEREAAARWNEHLSRVRGFPPVESSVSCCASETIRWTKVLTTVVYRGYRWRQALRSNNDIVRCHKAILRKRVYPRTTHLPG